MLVWVALHQVSVGPRKEENLKRVVGLLDSIDAELHVFPEYLMGVGEKGVTRDFVHEIAEPLDGPFVSEIADASRDIGSSVVFSAFIRDGGGVYNSAILVERGRVRTVYRKIHLFDAFGYRESSIFSPGRELALATIGGFNLGLAVCFDLRFPELFRALATRGANLFVVPSAWYRGPYKVEQWLTLTAARAHENTSFLLAVNQTGELFTGHSTLVTPMGHRLLDLGEEEKSIVVEIDNMEVERARKSVPVLTLLRRELYAEWYSSLH